MLCRCVCRMADDFPMEKKITDNKSGIAEMVLGRVLSGKSAAGGGPDRVGRICRASSDKGRPSSSANCGATRLIVCPNPVSPSKIILSRLTLLCAGCQTKSWKQDVPGHFLRVTGAEPPATEKTE
jgi:hypothetical protein